MFTKSLHKDTVYLVFSDFKAFATTFIWCDEKILNLLIVDLYHGAGDLVLELIIIVGINSVENLITRLRHNPPVDSVPNHGVTLARARLSVREQASVVTVPSCIQD